MEVQGLLKSPMFMRMKSSSLVLVVMGMQHAYGDMQPISRKTDQQR